MHRAARKSMATAFGLGSWLIKSQRKKWSELLQWGTSEHQWERVLVRATIRVLPIPPTQVYEVLILEDPEARELNSRLLSDGTVATVSHSAPSPELSPHSGFRNGNDLLGSTGACTGQSQS